MDGFHGRILVVDTTARAFEIRPVSDELAASVLGGKGLATRLLLDMNPAGVDPLAPDNHLIFATGPFCGTRLWGASRYGVFTKSPLTGLYCESYSGGRVPEDMDAAGFDAVVIHGASTEPLALSVHPDGCEFYEADDVWGMDAFDTEDAAMERFRTGEYANAGCVVIGPAGEQLVNFAVVSNDRWRCAGRAGAGTIMGSKRIKAIVFQGDRKRPVAHADKAVEFAKEFMQEGKDSPSANAFRGFGTTAMVAVLNNHGAFPAKYWSQGTCDHWERISGETLHAEHKVTPHACRKCFMACGRMTTLSSGAHEGLTVEGPEYETLYAFGGLCMIGDLGEIVRLNDLCDRLGMDTITAGNLVAFAMEAVERGKLDYPIQYGDSEATAELVHMIAAREGLGDVLAQGIRHAAKLWGMEDVAVHVKGMEPAGYDPRVLKGMGLSFATSPRGACHLRTTFYKAEMAGMIPPEQVDGKSAMVIDFEDRLIIFDTLILCRFFRDLYDWETLAEAVNLVTGLPENVDTLRTIAERISDMTREFNLREGMTEADDAMPRYIMDNPLPGGAELTDEDMATMLSDYYELRGWDEKGLRGN